MTYELCFYAIVCFYATVCPTEHVTFLMKYDILWNMIYGVKHFYYENKMSLHQFDQVGTNQISQDPE